ATALPVVVLQVGSMMIKSPGLAASIAPWIEPEAATWVGALPPTVTVTASTDCLPLPAVITSSPQRACEPPYCACCWMVHRGTCGDPAVAPGTVSTICVSLQLVILAVGTGMPPIVTFDTAVQVP